MHALRLSLPAFVSLLALSAAPARAATAAAPERFVARDTSMVLALPSLQTALEQASSLFATAASFPGGRTLEEERERLRARLGFDLFDRAWLEDAGIDPRRRAVIAAVELEGAPENDDIDLLLVLPVAHAARFERAFHRIAREELSLEPARSLPGTTRVSVYRGKDDDDAFAFAVSEGNALLVVQARAIPWLRKALTLPKAKQVATLPSYGELTRTLGTNLALVAYLPPESSLAKGDPELAGGFAMGLSGSARGFRVSMAFPLPEGSPMFGAATTDPAPLLAKLHPQSFVVASGRTDLRAWVEPSDLADPFGTGKKEVPAALRAVFTDFVAALGLGAAIGVSPVEPGGGDRAPPIADAPLAWVRGEMILGVADPARMRSAVRRWIAKIEPDAELSDDGPWVFRAGGGEIGVSVEGRRLLVAAGPKGALKALAARTGTRLEPPTPGSARALETASGLYVDVPKLLEHLRALPRGAFGKTSQGRRSHDSLQALLPILARFREVSLRTELAGTFLRGELTVEVEPSSDDAGAPDASPGASPEGAPPEDASDAASDWE